MLRSISYLLAGLALTLAVGCPSQEKRVIPTLPPPVHPAPRVQQPPPRPTPPPPRTTNLTGKTILIDPGHGGRDPGAWEKTKSRLPEKTIVLDIGNSVGRILQSRGAKVIATRTSDVFPSLDQRAAAAERNKVDLFVSIHADSAPNTNASGTEVFIYSKAGNASRTAARCMVAALKKAGLECRGITPKNLHVLREHSRPAILVECGFLTNTGDASKLNTAAYRARVAAAIAQGITDYLTSR